MLACEKGYSLDIIKFLINNNPMEKVNQQDKNGKTALIYACENHRPYLQKNMLNIIKYLIKMEANINIKDGKGYSAIFYACENQNLEILQHLVDHGANFKDYDLQGNSVYWHALKTNNNKIINYL
ncbi:ankyrin, partial [Neocallimastix californiae]